MNNHVMNDLHSFFQGMRILSPTPYVGTSSQLVVNLVSDILLNVIELYNPV